MGKVISRCIQNISISLLIAHSSPLLAGPIAIPDSARPGAVRPDLDVEERARIPDGPVPEVVDIPAVIDRPFDIDEGESIVVQQFRLMGASDLPKFDVSIAEIENLLNEIKESSPEGFTIGRLQEVADEITLYYRQKGLILAQAVIPVQTVDSGIVDVEVFEGRLGRVLAEGNKMYDQRLLERPFKHLIGEPVTKDDIEAALLTLTDYPGLSVFGVFQPGLNVGTADMVLKVQQEELLDISIRGDNHGVQETGRVRLRPEVSVNNLLNGADKLTFLQQQAYSPKKSLFQSIEYQRYMTGYMNVGFYWNHNSFQVGGELADSNITGKTKNFGLYMENSHIRSRRKNLSSRVELVSKDAYSQTAGQVTTEDHLGGVVLSMDYDSVDTKNMFDWLIPDAWKNEESSFQTGGINFVNVELTQGLNDFLGGMSSSNQAAIQEANGQTVTSREGNKGGLAAGQYTKLFAAFSRLQTLAPSHSILFRAEAQWSPDLLIASEQYSIGGPDNVRGFEPAYQLLDRAFFFSAEHLINAPFIANKPAFGNRTWGEILQVSLFYDHAIGRLNDPLVNNIQTYESFRSAGLGFRFNIPGAIDSRFMWAWAIGAPNGQDASGDPVNADVGNGRRPQFWGDFTFSF